MRNILANTVGTFTACLRTAWIVVGARATVRAGMLLILVAGMAVAWVASTLFDVFAGSPDVTAILGPVTFPHYSSEHASASREP